MCVNMYSAAEFDLDYDFVVKCDLELWYDWMSTIMDVERENLDYKSSL